MDFVEGHGNGSESRLEPSLETGGILSWHREETVIIASVILADRTYNQSPQRLSVRRHSIKFVHSSSGGKSVK